MYAYTCERTAVVVGPSEKGICMEKGGKGRGDLFSFFAPVQLRHDKLDAIFRQKERSLPKHFCCAVGAESERCYEVVPCLLHTSCFENIGGASCQGSYWE